MKGRFTYTFSDVNESFIHWNMVTVMSTISDGRRHNSVESMQTIGQDEARRRLEELEALESSILDAIPQAVVGLHNRRINFVNHAVRVIFGWTPKELIGKSAGLFYCNDEDSQKIAQIFYSALENQRTYSIEYPCRRKDGRKILCMMRASRIGDRLEERRIVITYEDITVKKQEEEELQRSREQLRNLSAHLQAAREEESTRIAREIHDELGQSLTALQMDLSWLDKHLPKEACELKDKAKRMNRLVDTTVESVHKISTELRPVLLDDLGLVAAMEWQIEEFRKRSGVRCEAILKCDDHAIDKDLSTSLFRIFQEALTNIARHADATGVDVKLIQTGNEIRLEVADNGRGISRKQIHNSKSLGIIGMRERAHLWGGNVTVNGKCGSGTIVTVKIPICQEDT